MAGSVNKVILIGNLGKDPEVRYLDNERAVANFSIATSESYTNRQGQKIENTEWHNIEVWDSLAKVCEKYLKKGDSVFIEGQIKTEKWTSKENNEPRSRVVIRARSMQMLGGRPAGQNNNVSASNTNVAEPAAPLQKNEPVTDNFSNTSEDNEVDDLPF